VGLRPRLYDRAAARLYWCIVEILANHAACLIRTAHQSSNSQRDRSMRHSPLSLVLAATVALFVRGSQADDSPPAALTPQQVWAGFDPAAEPVEVEVERACAKDSLALL